MPARRLKDGLPSDLRDLFLAYPFKRYQMSFQGTSHEGLADYHLNQTEREWQRSGAGGGWIAIAKGKTHRSRTLAFGRLMRSPWHCEVLGREIYRLRPFLYRPEREAAAGELIAVAVRRFRRAGGELLEVRVDPSDLVAEKALIKAGFHPLGTSVKLSVKSSDLRLTRRKSRAGVEIEPVEESDLRPLRDIVRKAHVTSHYFNESSFDARKVRTMFVRWVERCARGLADEVLVARTEGKVQGFVTLMVNRGIADFIGHRIGVIDFVAVHPAAQGQGIGSALLAAGLRRLRRTAPILEIRTELDNYPAIRTYSKLGFQLTSADRLWMLSKPGG
jgi:ribosomal protein S18 acetylase RimI-like enzyme